MSRTIKTTMAAVAILGSIVLASGQAQAAETHAAAGGARPQAPFAQVLPNHRDRADQWQLDMVPNSAPESGTYAFTYGSDMIFFYIFGAFYLPFFIGMLLLIADWLMRSLRKFRTQPRPTPFSWQPAQPAAKRREATAAAAHHPSL